MHVPCFKSVFHGDICGNFTWVQKFKFTHTIAFQSVLHDNSNNWADAGSLKVKYLADAGNFKRILKRHPLINRYNFFYCHPILKAMALEWCKAWYTFQSALHDNSNNWADARPWFLNYGRYRYLHTWDSAEEEGWRRRRERQALIGGGCQSAGGRGPRWPPHWPGWRTGASRRGWGRAPRPTATPPAAAVPSGSQSGICKVKMRLTV